MVWTIDYTRTARSQLRKLGKDESRRIIRYMDERVAAVEDPRQVGSALSGNLGGYWRYRIGRYRVICDIEDDVSRVLVVRVGGRDNVYR